MWLSSLRRLLNRVPVSSILGRGATRGKLSSRLRVEWLEDRTLPATFYVTTTADGGTGSLRDAINQANMDAVTDTIDFSMLGSGVQTIRPLSALPTITKPVIIDGYTH